MPNNVFPPRPPFPPAPPRGRTVPPPPPGVMQYIGARYVPIFADPIEWQPNKLYEPLTIVTYNNSSYTSKQTVPAGVSPDNGEYWVETGNFNAQINDLTTKIDGWDEEIAANTQTANEAKDIANAAQQAVADLDLTGLQQSVSDAIQKVDDLEPLVQDNTDNIATNTAAISKNETDIAKNAGDIANLQVADTALGNRVTAAENNIQTAQADITQVQTDINQNTTNIAANTSAISGLTSGLSDANTDIQKNSSDIATLKTDVAQNTDDISTANTNIAGMQSQVDTATGQIQTIKDQSDAATVEVERLTGIVGDENSGLIKDFNDLKQAVESGESVEALAGRVGLIETQVGKPASGEQPATGLEKKVADNTAAIASNSNSISANTTAIGDNAQSITDLETQVGHDADGTNPATGLIKEINDIKASIGTVTGDVGDRLDTLDSEVSTLKTTIGDSTSGLVKDVTDNMGDIAALQADVSAIQVQQTAQDTAISGNTTAISNAVTRISAVETGKQDKLTVDDTLNFTPTENPTSLSVKLPTVPLTKEEYAALETKENKLYIITDSDESSGGGTAGVQSFNGRSGVVLPQTGDYTAEMVGAVNKLYVDSSIIKPNLLDNWYFVNPVNQRGVSYDTLWGDNSYGIDRWRSSYGNLTKLTQNQGVYLAYGSNSIVEQRLEKNKMVTGQSYCLSIIANGSLYWFSFVFNNTNKNYSFDVGMGNLLAGILIEENYITYRIWNQSEIDQIVSAAYLEYGNYPSWCIKDGNNILIKKIPDYTLELLKCYRYYYKSPSAQARGISAYAVDTTTLFCFDKFPFPMRSTPTFSNIIARNAENGETVESLTVVSSSPEGIAKLSKSGELTTSKYYQLSYEASADL